MTESQIINDFFCPANRGTPKACLAENTAFQEAERSRQRYFLFAAAGFPCPRQIETDCDKSRQTAATAGVGYYRFTAVQRNCSGTGATGVLFASTALIQRQAVKTACLCIGIDFYLNSSDLKSVG